MFEPRTNRYCCGGTGQGCAGNCESCYGFYCNFMGSEANDFITPLSGVITDTVTCASTANEAAYQNGLYCAGGCGCNNGCGCGIGCGF